MPVPAAEAIQRLEPVVPSGAPDRVAERARGLLTEGR